MILWITVIVLSLGGLVISIKTFGKEEAERATAAVAYDTLADKHTDDEPET
jgi:hypothetical protein